MDILNTYLNRVDLLIIILVRMSGIFVVAPIFGARNLPVYFKIGLAFFTSLIISNIISPVDLTNYNNFISYSGVIFKELIIGILIGFIAYIVFTSIYMAGQLIDMQMGFGIVNIVDPLSNTQVPITGNFYYILTLLIFLMADGHHLLLSALFKSYEILPIGSAVFNDILVDTMSGFFTEMFIIGFKIAGPVVLSILVVDICLGMLTKTIPQLNVFLVGLPVKIFLGLLIILITIPAFVNVVGMLKEDIYKDVLKVMKEMVPR